MEVIFSYLLRQILLESAFSCSNAICILSVAFGSQSQLYSGERPLTPLSF